MQRDIRTTLAAGDFLGRQASKSVEAVVSGVEDIQRSVPINILVSSNWEKQLQSFSFLTFRPLSSLPERVKNVVTRSDSWDLLGQPKHIHTHTHTHLTNCSIQHIGQGIDPTEKSSLIGSFDSATTKQRAEKIKKKRVRPIL